jgi:hypothetical protein
MSYPKQDYLVTPLLIHLQESGNAVQTLRGSASAYYAIANVSQA